jgi:NADPH-ferrihemoprotein reductase
VTKFQEELLSLKDIENSMAVFCLATYGEGDPTDNAMEFYEWITNNEIDFTGLNYAVSVIEMDLLFLWFLRV